MKNGSRAKMNFLLSYQKNYERTEVYIKKKEKRRSEYIKKPRTRRIWDNKTLFPLQAHTGTFTPLVI